MSECTIIAKPGSFLAEVLPVIGPRIADEEMEIRRLEPLILQIMSAEPERIWSVDDVQIALQNHGSA